MDESLEHLITSCHYSKNFWAEVMKWFVKQGIKISYLSDKDIIAAKQYIIVEEKFLYLQLECLTHKLKRFINLKQL